MCKFCSKTNFIKQNLPDEGLNHYDSASYFLLAGEYFHIAPQYMGVYGKRKHSIFNIKIKYCPFCGKQLDFGNPEIYGDEYGYDFDIGAKD